MKRILLSLATVVIGLVIHGQEAKNFIREITTDLNSFKILEQKLKRYRSEYEPDTFIFQGKKQISRLYKEEPQSFLNTNMFYDEIYIPRNKEEIKGNGKINDVLSIRICSVADKIIYCSLALRKSYNEKNYKFNYDTVFRYINEIETSQILDPYNKNNNTDFTWRDLFEEDNAFSEFAIFPAVGEKFLATPAEKFASLVTNKEAEIIKNCKSFNPVRKAFGALWLYAFKNKGSGFNADEKKIFESIIQSQEFIKYRFGCIVEDEKSISSVLTNEELENSADLILRLNIRF